LFILTVFTAALQFAEQLDLAGSGAKALTEEEGLIAALKALRHPKSGFQQTGEPRSFKTKRSANEFLNRSRS
jgi:hypothetical protein